ncbi:hypothetical protein [Actinoalloteichus hymeniacidonis]|uniref:hypothetical protein n=1 Tax=Actinoalloteichus hymeniacidonis TaxID=340345 RepID=UPI0018313B9C|nr:hypothetical protein [Actinoalloteichus hymeniacidonis]MBB5906605.1 hypothetical protein [Actinoalloteichus hymeniacidonis]
MGRPSSDPPLARYFLRLLLVDRLVDRLDGLAALDRVLDDFVVELRPVLFEAPEDLVVDFPAVVRLVLLGREEPVDRLRPVELELVDFGLVDLVVLRVVVLAAEDRDEVERPPADGLLLLELPVVLLPVPLVVADRLVVDLDVVLEADPDRDEGLACVVVEDLVVPPVEPR